MAFLNLQTQTPKLSVTNIKSPIGKLGNSIAKIPFGGVAKAIGSQPNPLQISKIDQPGEPSALYGVVDALTADVQSLRQEQTETAEIINDIGNALATDFANRITEEKAQNTLLNKQRAKLRQRTKEENLEKGTARKTLGAKSGGIGLSKVGGGIFGKLISFFTTIGAGIGLSTVFKWLQDEGNRQALSSVFKAITDHWKWIVGGIGAVLAVGVAKQLAGLAASFAVLGPILTSPLFWAGVGIAMAAGHQGLGNEEKNVLRDLNLLPGGASEENREMLAQKYEKIIKNPEIIDFTM